MKYSVFFIIFLLFFSFHVEAYEDDESSFYLGSKVNIYNKGYIPNIDFISNINVLKKKYDMNQKLNKFPISLIFGYETNPYFSFELTADNNTFKTVGQLIDQINFKLSEMKPGIKISYPVNDQLMIYNRINTNIDPSFHFNEESFDNFIKKPIKFVPTFSVGIERKIKKNISYQVDYSLKNDLLNLIKNRSINFKNGFFSVSLVVKLNNSDFDNNDYQNSFIMHPETNVKETVLFPFGSSKLNSSSKLSLEKLNEKIKKMNFSDVRYNLVGYIDQIGNEDINENISHDRIKSIINYLRSRGVSRKYIKERELKSKSIVNKFCKNINDKSLLMSCLAPDRRVEIDVHGKW